MPPMPPLTDDQRAQLAEPLPRDVVRKLPGKTAADYVSGHYVITRLNTVFGHDGWADAYEPPVVREGDRPTIYVRGTLTAAGVTRGDVGVGVSANGTPDSFETAIKTAYTDCLKRCARKLGASFGLALYEKERTGVGYSTIALSMLAEIDELTTLDAINGWVKANAAHVEKLDADERDVVKGACAAARRAALAAVAAPAPDAPSSPASSAPATPPTPAAPIAAVASPSADPIAAVASPSADPIAPFRARVTLCASRSELVAVRLANRKVVSDLPRERAKDFGTVEEFDQAVAKAEAITKEPAHWSVVADVLAGLAAAADLAATGKVVDAHGPAVAKLPNALKQVLSAALTQRRSALTPKPATDAAAALEAEMRSASDIPALDAAGDRALAAAKAGQITVTQAQALARLQAQIADAMEREPSAQEAA